MREEELNISGPDKPTGPQANPATPAAEVNEIKAKVGSIAAELQPGMTNADIVDAVIRAPVEKLIPWEECVLPSNGLYYGWPDGTILVRAMGQTAEKVLTTQRLSQSGQTMDYLFNECCQLPNGFATEELLIGDRTFLLYYLRGITHGNMYEFAITCPNTECASVSTHNYDLNQLVRTIVHGDPRLGQEPFRIVLPYLSESIGREFYIGVRFLRGFDGNDILAKRRARKKAFARPGGVRTRTRNGPPINMQRQQETNHSLDETINENMEKIIQHVMGETDQFTIRNFVTKLHGRDTAAIREWLREHTPGIDNTVTVQCPDCLQDFTVELPITESFFRPTQPAGA